MCGVCVCAVCVCVYGSCQQQQQKQHHHRDDNDLTVTKNEPTTAAAAAAAATTTTASTHSRPPPAPKKQVVNVNVTHAMVTAVRKKALALPQDRVTTGARSRQPFRMRNRCGEDLALTIRRSGGGKEEVRFTLVDGGDDTVDFGSSPVGLGVARGFGARGAPRHCRC